jgi:hypothetical protein
MTRCINNHCRRSINNISSSNLDLILVCKNLQLLQVFNRCNPMKQKIVPTDTLTSMFEDPSKGSIKNNFYIYCCDCYHFLQQCVVIILFRAIPHTISRLISVWIKKLHLHKHQFCWSSPWIFVHLLYNINQSSC